MASVLPGAALPLLLLCCFLAMPSISSLNPVQECSQMGDLLRSFRIISRCNQTMLEDKQKAEVQDATTVLLLPLLYLVALVVGLPSNLLALWVLVFHTQKLPSTFLLINLTATDLLLLLALPLRAAYYFNHSDWAFGELPCRLVTALFYGNMYGSVLSLMLVSVDRYVAVVHPFGARALRGHRMSLLMTTAVWVVILAAMLPLLLSQQSYRLDDPPITTCHDALPGDEQDNFFFPYFTCLFTACFLLPTLVLLFCYGSVLRTLLASGGRYGHAVRIVALVLLVFVACFLPSNLLLLLHYWDSRLVDDEQGLYKPYIISLAVSCFSPCVDPFLYYYVSEGFRLKVREALCRRGNKDSAAGNKASYSLSSSAKSNSTLLSKSSRNAIREAQELKGNLV